MLMPPSLSKVDKMPLLPPAALWKCRLLQKQKKCVASLFGKACLSRESVARCACLLKVGMGVPLALAACFDRFASALIASIRLQDAWQQQASCTLHFPLSDCL